MPHFYSVSPELIERASGLGFDVIAWTVNGEEDFNKLVNRGVDGLVTDRYLELASLYRNRFA